MIPEAGMIIKTKFGTAKVIRTTRDGVYVEMQSGPMHGKNINLSTSVIEEIEPSINRLKVTPPIPKNKNSNINITTDMEEDTERIKKYKCIDALRFGLVPHEYIEDLTLGYDDLEDPVLSSFPKITDELPQKVHTVEGEFGDGKSHTMSLIRHLAIKEGYLVGRVEVDGKTITMSNPRTLLYTIMNSLKGEDLNIIHPLLDLYLKSINTGNDDPSISSRDDRRVNKIYRLTKRLNELGHIEDLDYVLNDILICNDDLTITDAKAEISKIVNDSDIMTKINEKNGEIGGIYPMISQKLIDRPSDFLESILGTALIAQQVGYKGFIITIDEYEVEETFCTGYDNKKKAEKLLELLCNYFSGDSQFANAPLAIYIASVPSSEYIEGKFSIDSLMKKSGGDNIHLVKYNNWNNKDPDQIRFANKIHSLYVDVYNCNPLPEKQLLAAIDKITYDLGENESGAIRGFMKCYIGFLDSEYGPPISTP